MLKAIRRLAAFCLCIGLCWGLMIPASSEAASSKPDDLSVLKRQAEAFTNTKARLPELARLVSNEGLDLHPQLDSRPNAGSGSRNVVHQQIP
jgi:hypothetical protein